MKHRLRLSGITSLFKKHMPLLHTDPTLKIMFTEGRICSVLKGNQLLAKIVISTIFSKPQKKAVKTSFIINCNKSDICQNYLCFNHFTYSVTTRKYYKRGVLH